MSANPLKQTIRNSFAKAAPAYNYHALVQQEIIDKLIRRIKHIALPFEPRILEIGAGTGILTRKLQNFWPHAEYVITDLSDHMLDQARQIIPIQGPRTSYVAMDAEHLCFDRGFDLIVSSMILHWLPDPPASMEKINGLLNSGGIFAFAFLAENSFSSWRQSCHLAGVPCGLWDYPTLEQVKKIPGVMAVQERIQTFFDHPIDFLHNLKSIGAATPQKLYRVQSAANLKKALEQAAAIKPFYINYEVIFGAYHAARDIADLPNALNASPITS